MKPAMAALLLPLLACSPSSSSPGAVSGQDRNTVTPRGYLSLLGVQIGRDTLAEVSKKFGPCETKKCSGGEEASTELCYTISGGKPAIVSFRAGFSGAWRVVDSYGVFAEGAAPDSCLRCPSAVKANGNEELWIGMSREEIRKRLGEPASRTATKWVYRTQGRRAMTMDEQHSQTRATGTKTADAAFDVLDTIEVSFAEDRAVAIEVWHTESY